MYVLRVHSPQPHWPTQVVSPPAFGDSAWQYSLRYRNYVCLFPDIFQSPDTSVLKKISFSQRAKFLRVKIRNVGYIHCSETLEISFL